MEGSRLNGKRKRRSTTIINKTTFKRRISNLVIKLGIFNAANVILKETAINGTVLRVHLLRTKLKVDVHKFKKKNIVIQNYSSKVSRFGRVIKKKQMSDFEESPLTKMATEENTEINTLKIKEKINSRLHSLKSKIETDKNDYLSNIKITSVSAIKKKKIPVLPVYFNRKRNNHVTYYLSMASDKPPQEGKLNYDFNKLVKDVKTMKLPAPEWRIKIMIKKKAITGIVFTDKKELERCVTFSLRCDYYKVLIDNKPVLLLGAPLTIDSVTDLEALLDIVQNINCADQMLLYT